MDSHLSMQIDGKLNSASHVDYVIFEVIVK